MAKTLTDKQQRFLDVLFCEAGGDPVRARNIAGYSESTNPTTILRGLQEEVAEKLQEALGTNASIRAYRALISVLEGTDNPLGRGDRIKVARDLLDRAGFKGTDKVEVSTKDAIFILPPKE